MIPRNDNLLGDELALRGGQHYTNIFTKRNAGEKSVPTKP